MFNLHPLLPFPPTSQRSLTNRLAALLALAVPVDDAPELAVALADALADVAVATALAVVVAVAKLALSALSTEA